jgi:hypothetical protein
MNRQGKNMRFTVAQEGERVKWQDRNVIPTIEMICDNDEES